MGANLLHATGVYRVKKKKPKSNYRPRYVHCHGELSLSLLPEHYMKSFPWRVFNPLKSSLVADRYVKFVA